MKLPLILPLIPGLLLLTTISYAEIGIQPAGIAVRVEGGDTLTAGMTLTNDLDEPVVFTINLTEIDHEGNRLRGNLAGDGRIPVRDRRGEPDDAGYFWIDSNEDDGPDYQWIDVINREGAQRLNLGDNGNSGELDLGFEFPWYGEWYTSVRVCTNGWFAFGPDEDGANSNIPECPNEDRPNNIVAVEAHDLILANQSSMYFWTDGEGQAVVSWIGMLLAIAPIRMNLTFQAALDAETGTVKMQYGIQQGIQNNLISVGYENQDGSLGANYLYHQAGIAEGLAVAITGPFSKWLELEPRIGQIEPNGSFDLDLTFLPEDMEAGTYEMLMRVTAIAHADQDDADTSFAEASVVMTVDNAAYTLSGRIITEQDGSPVAGAVISLDAYRMTRISDEEGNFSFTNLPDGTYRLAVMATDYLNQTVDAEINGGDAESIISLLYAELTLDPESISRDVSPDDQENIEIYGINSGNGPLTYTTDRRLPGDADADPWELRREYNTGERLEEARVEGVAFDGEHFYLAGAHGEDPNIIYVTTRDGEPVREFVQPGESTYGMKDLDYDGELLWGSGERRVFGFTTEGEIVYQFEGPVNPVANIAYDSDRDLLWVSGNTSNIFAYTKEGQATGDIINRRGLRIYGLAFWPEDPDGHTLYALNSPAANILLVHKIDPTNGDTMLARNLNLPAGIAPTGAFITNAFDIYSWVMMVSTNIAPNLGGDRSFIYQLAGRTDWFSLNPAAGVIDPGGRQRFEVLLDATGLPAATFNGEFIFTHDGIGRETSLPVELDVIGGPAHGERNLDLLTGWNIVSANVDPDDPDVRVISRPLVEQGRLTLMKDAMGHFYMPARDYNNIDGWNVEDGYWMKVTENCQLTIGGLTVPPDQPIPLTTGWQAVAYFPREPIDAVTAFSGIVDQLILAKDAMGRFYLPARNYSNMGDLREGQGYQIKVNQDIELVYQTGGRRLSPRSELITPTASHFGEIPPIGQNMSLLITTVTGATLIDGDQIAAINCTGNPVGIGWARSGMVGLAVWGDDPSTAEPEGLSEGENFTLRLWETETETESELSVSAVLTGDGLTYKAEGLVVIETAVRERIPQYFTINQAFPNPFNSVIDISYYLPWSSEISIEVSDLSGRTVATLIRGRAGQGSHRLVWNAEGVASGVYLLRMQGGNSRLTHKVVLMR